MTFDSVPTIPPMRTWTRDGVTYRHVGRQVVQMSWGPAAPPIKHGNTSAGPGVTWLFGSVTDILYGAPEGSSG